MDLKYPVTKYFYRKFSRPTARILNKLNFKPNQVTFLSFILGVLSGVIFFYRMYIYGLIVLFISEILDCADGDLARLQKKISKKGEFIDSFLDRIVEVVIFYGLILTNPSQLMLIGTLALTWSILVSYARSKAEVIGVSCDIGIASRDIRMLIFMLAVLFEPLYMNAIYYGFILISILSFITVIQRFYCVYSNVKK
jgi:CDP-diacylglycerol--glycerol-3-phosphate 3-phosphatidyltransferase